MKQTYSEKHIKQTKNLQQSNNKIVLQLITHYDNTKHHTTRNTNHHMQNTLYIIQQTIHNIRHQTK